MPIVCLGGVEIWKALTVIGSNGPWLELLIVAPLMQTQTLPFHPVYVALAIGCGSKPFPWMNDSGFWQVSTMSGMTTRQTLQMFSAALTIMGFVGFAITLLGAWLLPFSGK